MDDTGAPVASATRPRLEQGSAAGKLSLSEKVQSLRLETHEPPRSNGRLPWTLTFLLACSTAYFAYRAYDRPDSPDETASASAISGSSALPEPAAGATSPAAPAAGTGGVVLESKGYIIPAHQILVSPKVSGMVLKLMIEEGQRVKKGAVLAQLETVEYQADLDRALATLAITRQRLLELENGNRPEEIQQAKAELDEATAQRHQLEAAWKRSRDLRARNTLSISDYEIAESAFQAMDRRVQRLKSAHELMVKGPRIERVELARAEVGQAAADLAKAEWRLSNATIVAPISGTILKKNAEEGNIVNPIAFNGSFSLCEMADLSDLEVDMTIQERDIALVFPGQKCTVRTEAFPDRVYQGVVSRLMPIADRAKGAVPVRVKLTIPREEEGVYLKPEMGAIVAFLPPADSTGK